MLSFAVFCCVRYSSFEKTRHFAAKMQIVHVQTIMCTHLATVHRFLQKFANFALILQILPRKGKFASMFVFLLQYAPFCSKVQIVKFLLKKVQAYADKRTFCVFFRIKTSKLKFGEKTMLQATPQILDDMDCYLPDKNTTQKIARFFALFADPSRLQLLSALSISPLCVSDLSSVVQMNQTTVSHQLRILRDMNVVKCERDGKILKYSISNPKINEILLVGVEYLGF